jgi:hypothetical protein
MDPENLAKITTSPDPFLWRINRWKKERQDDRHPSTEGKKRFGGSISPRTYMVDVDDNLEVPWGLLLGYTK